jgi:hypothetical protein
MVIPISEMKVLFYFACVGGQHIAEMKVFLRSAEFLFFDKKNLEIKSFKFDPNS